MKWKIAMLAVCMMAVGCDKNKKTDPMAGPAGLETHQTAALDVPATPPAAPAHNIPAPQPAFTEAEQPVTVADASDSYSPAPSRTRGTTSGTKYKIKKGESLWSIAQSRYGNGNKWKAIAAANPQIDPNHVQAGQTIILP